MVATATPVAMPRQRARQIPWNSIMIYAALIFGAFFMVMPFLFMISTSLKPQNQVFLYPPRWIPNPIVWANYPTAAVRLTAMAFLNSVIFTSVIVLGQGLITTMGGFAFARLKFPGKNAIFLCYLGTMMIPFVVTMIPTFVIVARLGWQDTYQGLIVPILAHGAFGTFLFRQFFMTIPEEIGDAATVDGANPLDVYWRIYLPLSKPAMTAYGVITALAAWNNYIWPLIVVQTKELRPLTLVIAQFASQMNAELHILMACVALSLLPIFLLYLLGQRFFVEGVAMSGIKG
jgi:multiple sugar transport system permease protein